MPNQWTLGIAQVGPTDEQMEAMCAEAELGRSMSSIAAAANVSPNTLQHWWRHGKAALEKGLAGKELTRTEMIYVAFAEPFTVARAKGIRANEQKLEEKAAADSGTWTAYGWKLERGHRDEFGRQPEVVQGGAQVVFVVEGRPARELPPESFIDGEANRLDADDQRALPAAPAAASVP